MNNNINDIINVNPSLLDFYTKCELQYIKTIYVRHIKCEKINETDFSFIKFVSKLHELGFKPHKYSIIRPDITKNFDENNIILQKSNVYQNKLIIMAKKIKNNSKTELKMSKNPYVIINPQFKPKYTLYVKQQSSPSITNDLLRFYSKKILIILKQGYYQRERANLIETGFTFEKYVIKLHTLSFIDGDSHTISRIDTTKKFDENNIQVNKTDKILKKIEDMSEIVRKNKRVHIKIKNNEPFQLISAHHSRNPKRIYIKQ